MAVLIRLYVVVILTAAVAVFGGCLLSVEPVYAYLVALPMLLAVLMVVFTFVPFDVGPDAKSRGELESLLGVKRDGVLHRHAARIGPRRTRPAKLGPPASSDTPLDRLVRAKRTLPPSRA